jgi:hypothetical protein
VAREGGLYVVFAAVAAVSVAAHYASPVDQQMAQQSLSPSSFMAAPEQFFAYHPACRCVFLSSSVPFFVQSDRVFVGPEFRSLRRAQAKKTRPRSSRLM